MSNFPEGYVSFGGSYCLIKEKKPAIQEPWKDGDEISLIDRFPVVPLTWENYCEWRRSKCPQRDLSDPVQRDEEITQATLELIGEVAEVNHLVSYQDYACDNMIDECEDVIFCACWVIDAWEHTDFLSGSTLSRSGRANAGLSIEAIVLNMSHYSGILANFLKKKKYQKKEVNPLGQYERAIRVIDFTAELLTKIGSSTEEALQVNIAKLNKRYKKGWVPGGGER